MRRLLWSEERSLTRQVAAHVSRLLRSQARCELRGSTLNVGNDLKLQSVRRVESTRVKRGGLYGQKIPDRRSDELHCQAGARGSENIQFGLVAAQLKGRNSARTRKNRWTTPMLINFFFRSPGGCLVLASLTLSLWGVLS